jgi:crossover junction endodeoxyribonuclease RuvC
MLVAGIDPGKHGAAAVVDTEALRVLDVMDLPVMQSGAIAWVDGAVLGDWLEEWNPEQAIVEHVGVWAGDTPGMFGRIAMMCRIAGGIETMLSSLSIPIVHASPQAWKKRAGLSKQGKEQSLALAKARLSWPAGTMYLAKHEGRAEAALIALYGRAPQAPARAPKRSKIVDQALAENVPAGPLFRGNLA